MPEILRLASHKRRKAASDEAYFSSLLILLCQKIILHGSAGKLSLKVKREKNAQGGDGVRDMALSALDCHEGCNPRERQAPRVG
jgi:hypothetical protein